MSARHITLFDTTLRDGAQSSGVDFSLADKRVLANALDQFGIDYIEGGWPGANPSDSKFFANPPQFAHAKLVAFGMTCRAERSAGNDPSLTQVLSAKSPLACLVGKSSAFQVDEVLKIAREENLRMIKDSCAETVKRKGEGNCFFDAEHFFDGYKLDSSYALACLEAAAAGGASTLVLCDTNGGTLPFEVERITSEVSARLVNYEKINKKINLGIHAHNDTGNAIANSLAAVRAGADQVQGTLNGIGERCGNADLIAIIPNLMLKMGLRTSVEEQSLTRLVDLSRLLDHRLNRVPRAESPYVGVSAFAHKGGLHGSAVARETRAYEHIAPERVGNRRKIVVSDQAGRANLKMRLGDLGLGEFSDGQLNRLLEEVKQRESEGYSYEDSEASLSLLALRVRGNVVDFYTIDRFRVMDERRWNALGEEVIESEAIVSLRAKSKETDSKKKAGEKKVGESVERLTAAVSEHGPVNALDKALRKGLTELYPPLEGLRLVDYHVRIIPPDEGSSGTEATTRVSIDFMNEGGESWTTVGVSANIIVASLRALDDSYRYMLFRSQQKKS